MARLTKTFIVFTAAALLSASAAAFADDAAYADSLSTTPSAGAMAVDLGPDARHERIDVDGLRHGGCRVLRCRVGRGFGEASRHVMAAVIRAPGDSQPSRRFVAPAGDPTAGWGAQCCCACWKPAKTSRVAQLIGP